jgi:hypothetical protein
MMGKVDALCACAKEKCGKQSGEIATQKDASESRERKRPEIKRSFSVKWL